MKLTAITLFLFCVAFITPRASAVTATYSTSNQSVTLTGLGGSGGVGQTRLSWGNCVYDGTNTNCTVSAPYTGVGGGGTISIVFTYPGNGPSPFLANSITPGSNNVTFAPFAPGTTGTITVTLTESTGATVSFPTTSAGFPNFNFFYTGTQTCTGIASASCSIGQVGLVPGATITGVVTGSFDDTPVVQSVISASSYGGFSALAPGTWMEIYGLNLANLPTASRTWAGSDFNGNAAPTSLGFTTVTIGGQAAFIDYVSPTQVNAQVPSNIAIGPEPVVVSTQGGTSLAYMITVNTTEPGLLAPGVFNLPAGQYAGAVFPAASAAAGTTFVLPPGAVNGVASARAAVGNTIIFYGVGFGTVTPNIPAGQIVTQTNQLSANVQISFAGVPAMVQFAGLVNGNLGLYQFNVVVPNVAASDAVPVTFSVGGVAGTQKLIVAVSN